MKKINFDSIIFDMDGVLISNDSYNQAIIKTVEYYLSKRKSLKIEVSINDIYEVKKIKGFNNDWDVSFSLIEVFEKNIPQELFGNYIKNLSTEIRESNKYKKIKDVFQAYYLGVNLFQEIYKRPTPLNVTSGLMENEKMLLDIKILSSFADRYKLAIATSRPRFEALFAAKFQKISPQIIDMNAIIAKEDCQREKPNPDPLIEAQKRINGKKSVYIGDTINDVIAAKKAGMFSIYIGTQNLGDMRVNNVNKIKEFLL